MRKPIWRMAPQASWLTKQAAFKGCSKHNYSPLSTNCPRWSNNTTTQSSHHRQMPSLPKLSPAQWTVWKCLKLASRIDIMDSKWHHCLNSLNNIWMTHKKDTLEISLPVSHLLRVLFNLLLDQLLQLKKQRHALKVRRAKKRAKGRWPTSQT